MNPWDFVTWLSSVALATSAVVIFGFFLRDARSIFDREMHDQDEEPKNSFASESAAGGARPEPPEDLSR
jgi:flagellar biosynthesis/type III secretory pathway M-ring protein FliF/YscJ